MQPPPHSPFSSYMAAQVRAQAHEAIRHCLASVEQQEHTRQQGQGPAAVTASAAAAVGEGVACTSTHSDGDRHCAVEEGTPAQPDQAAHAAVSVAATHATPSAATGVGSVGCKSRVALVLCGELHSSLLGILAAAPADDQQRSTSDSTGADTVIKLSVPGLDPSVAHLPKLAGPAARSDCSDTAPAAASRDLGRTDSALEVRMLLAYARAWHSVKCVCNGVPCHCLYALHADLAV